MKAEQRAARDNKKHRRERDCPKCGNKAPHEWVSWGSYLDKDLKCKKCQYTIDVWDC